ncbi:hypothetical protein CB1_000394024 [Camelus ferus]|nr:hypothetical protein CB1_000394024 [Camelus ferus]
MLNPKHFSFQHEWLPVCHVNVQFLYSPTGLFPGSSCHLTSRDDKTGRVGRTGVQIPALALSGSSVTRSKLSSLQLRFLRNGPGAGSHEGDTGPSDDGSLHAWSPLTVKSRDKHHCRCLVQYAGLAQPLRVELESPAKSSLPVTGIVISFTAHGSGCRRSSAMEEDEQGATSPLDCFPRGQCSSPPAHSWPVQGC